MMGLGTSTIRYLLYGINLLFVLTGFVIICVGISINLSYANYVHFIQAQYIYVNDFLIVIGIGIFAIAVLGWCGALHENSFVTLMFSAFLLLIFFLEIAVGISGYLLRNTARHSLLSSLTLSNQSMKNSSNVDAWDKLQGEFDCCGIFGQNDWKNLTGEHNLPASCCTYREISDTIENITKIRYEKCTYKSRNVHNQGCIYALEYFLSKNSFSIELLGFSLAILQLIGIAASCQLSSEFRKGYHSV